MSVVSIPSLDLFTPALSYHTSAQMFLSDQGAAILSRAKALSAELHSSSPQQADEFDKTIQVLQQRFTDEAQLCGEAVTNLTSHFNFLATAEAKLSGTTPATLPVLTLPNTNSWLQIHNTPVDSCFDELDNQLYQFKEDLDAFEPRVKDFEHLIWVAVNQPDQLKNIVQVPTAGWEPDWLKAGIQDVVNAGTDAATAALRPAIDFIQAHQTDIFSMIDHMRQGFESIFLPRTDPHVLQAHIDYLSALKSAYDTNIRAPFDYSTRPVATQYQPPAGQNSYQLAWASIPDQQLYTSNALGNIIEQLQQLQGLNQLIAMDLVIIVGAVAAFLIAIAVTAFIVTIVGTLPTMLISGGTVAGETFSISGFIAAFGTTLADIVGTTFLGITIWSWIPIVAIGLAIGADIGWIQRGSITWVEPDGTALPDDLKKIAEQLWNKFKDLLKAMGLSDDQIVKLIAYLAATYCSANYADKLLQSILDLPANSRAKFVALLTQFLDGTASTGVARDVKRIIFIMTYYLTLGYSPVDVGLAYTDASGSPRDIDVKAAPIPPQKGPVYYAESGGPGKGDTTPNKGGRSNFQKFESQIQALKAEAANAKPPAVAQFFLEEPAPQPNDPSDPKSVTNWNKQWTYFNNAKTYAETELGSGNVIIVPYNDKSSICSP